MAEPVIIDTDTGVDDAIALLLALRSPELHVEAITTVAGNATVDRCTENVKIVLDVAKPSKYPCVARGAEHPLVRQLITAPEVHGDDGLGNVASEFAPRERPIEEAPAWQLIIEKARALKGELNLITLGPLTNLALALEHDPDLPKLVKHVFTMGGAFRVPGNTTPVGEFNFVVDPEAAQQVLKAGFNLTLLPLDATQRVLLTPENLTRELIRSNSPTLKFIERITAFTIDYHRRVEQLDGMFLHDPVTVGAALWPWLFQSECLHVRVETKGEFTYGMSIGEFHRIPRAFGSEHPNAIVVTGLDVPQFFLLFFSRLSNPSTEDSQSSLEAR